MLGVADWSGAVTVDGASDHARAAGSAPCPLDAAVKTDVDASTAAPSKSPLPMAAGVTDETLRALYDRLLHLAGFRDVHFMLQGPPRFVAWFDAAAALPELPVIDAPYPVTARNLEADLAPSMRDAAMDPPLVPGPCGNNRPGGALGFCTRAWQVTDDEGRLYVATAGHCIPHVGWTFSFGTAVYKRADGVGADFGLILVDDVVAPGFDPAMCHWGGPVAAATDADAGFGDVVRMYGHGMGFGQVEATRARSGVLDSFGVDSFTYVGPVMQGDSGSPVMLADGLALGVHTHGLNGIGGVQLPITTPTVKWGTRLDAGLAMAEADLGVDLTLLTAPLA